MAGGFLALQACLSLVMFLVTAAAGWAPLVLLTIMKKKGVDQSKSGWLSYLSCFSGGVFLATCFLDIVPHIIENYQEILETYDVSYPVPLNQVFICCGFFLVYLIEETTAVVFGSAGHGHSHGSPPPLTVDVKKEVVTSARLLEENGDPGHLSVENHQSRRSLAVEDASPWVVSNEQSNVLKSLTFAVAMSFHSLLEGFALGVQETTTAIYALFFSLLLHKSIEAFSVGLQISKSNSEKIKVVILTILIYSLMTPIGTMIGSVLQSNGEPSFYKDGLILFLECLAAGTFIYVTFLEILAVEKGNHFNSFKQLAAIFAGFLVILILQIFFGHEAHGHDHSNHVHAAASTVSIAPSL